MQRLTIGSPTDWTLSAAVTARRHEHITREQRETRRKLTRTLALWARGNVLADLPSSANEAGALLRALKQGAAHSSPWSPRRLVDAHPQDPFRFGANVLDNGSELRDDPSSARHSAQRQECRPPIAFVVR